MVEQVDETEIEGIVGTERRSKIHMGRAVSAEKTVYILHSYECLDLFPDLQDCPFSQALNRGINLEYWEGFEDKPVVLRIWYGQLIPRGGINRDPRKKVRRTVFDSDHPEPKTYRVLNTDTGEIFEGGSMNLLMVITEAMQAGHRIIVEPDDRGLEMSPFNRALVLRAALRADNGCEHCAAQVMAPILKVYPDNWDQITANMGEDYPNPQEVLDMAREIIERGEV